MSSNIKFFALVLTMLLAGCNSNPHIGSEAGFEPSLSTPARGSESRERAAAHTELGRLYLQESRYEVALNEARIAVGSDGSYAPAYNLAAIIYMELGKNELAESNFREALRLAGGDPEINNDYGWFLCRSGRPRDSIAYFKTALRNPLYQMPVRTLVNLGVCSITLKEDKEAEEYLLRALGLEAGNLAANYWLADIAYRSGKFAEAQQRLRDLHAKLEPTAESAWLALRVERKLGNRSGEARYMGILSRKYRDSVEYQKMARGEFD